jgi:hypothetical protein
VTHDEALDLYARYLGLRLTIMTMQRLPISFLTHPERAGWSRTHHLARLDAELAGAEAALVAAGLGHYLTERGSAGENAREGGVGEGG